MTGTSTSSPWPGVLLFGGVPATLGAFGAGLWDAGIVLGVVTGVGLFISLKKQADDDLTERLARDAVAVAAQREVDYLRQRRLDIAEITIADAFAELGYKVLFDGDYVLWTEDHDDCQVLLPPLPEVGVSVPLSGLIEFDRFLDWLDVTDPECEDPELPDLQLDDDDGWNPARACAIAAIDRLTAL